MPRIATYRDLGCLVTGASSGIGHDIALQLAEQGARLVVSARRKDRLDALAQACNRAGAGATHVVVADLSQDGAADRLYEAAVAALGAVDVLVNNAGFAVPGVFVNTDRARTQAMLAVNTTASFVLMRRALPDMVRRKRGGVLNVSSVAGHQCAPYTAAYSGTKAFLLNMSNSVHQELKESGVAVTALCPGVTDTEFFGAAGYGKMTGFLDRRMPSAKVARAGLRGLAKGRMEVVPGFTNKMLLFTQRFVPRSWAAAVSRRLMGGRPRPVRPRPPEEPTE